MGFLERAIRNGISKGIGDAVGKAVQKALEPKATEWANKTAEQLDQAAQTAAEQPARSADDSQSAFANLQRSMENYAAALNEQAEAAAGDNDAAVLARWDTVLPAYPVWCCGGRGYDIEEFDGVYLFTACFESNALARAAVDRYREVLMQNGFRPAGEYPSTEHLYKTVDGRRCHVDTEHCFDSDDCAPAVAFHAE